MLVASDGHHIRPVSWRHDDSSDLGAGDVERGGTFLRWALDAGTAVLICILAVAEYTLLKIKQKMKSLIKVGEEFTSTLSRDLFLAFSFINIQGSWELYYGIASEHKLLMIFKTFSLFLFIPACFMESCITCSTSTLSQSYTNLPSSLGAFSFSNPFIPFPHPECEITNSQQNICPWPGT